MLKRTGLAVVALLAVLILISPPQTNAAVRFGVGVGPAYAYPVVPYAYVYPSGYAPYYGNPYPYSYLPPAYAYPYGGVGFYWGGHYYDGRHDGWNRGGNWDHHGFHGDTHRR
jgi:hypothetical protein